ncbi:MAG: efflux RND transporter periplasmic adaptor subunit [Neisseriaceae bacterium]|nr:efflux RND transporter periplasmic adaptor subunit [Neisseriaceae bacterium]MBP6863448.1 efflux RND transporter periplasmic adaptor subunit [Neisseriaceae bacterium]
MFKHSSIHCHHGTRRFLWLAVCASVVLGLSACSDKQEDPSGGRPTASITALTVTEAPLDKKVSAFAQIEAKYAPNIATEVAGIVTQILVSEGQQVTAGQPLAHIDAADLKSQDLAASADVARLQALATEQANQLRRDRTLFEQGFISQAALENTQAQVTATQKQVAAAQAQQAQTQRNVGRSVISAPYSGSIQTRMVNLGEYVNPGSVLFGFSSTGHRQVKLSLGRNDGALVRIGQTILLGDSAPYLELTVSEVRSDLDPASRARIIYAPLPDDAPYVAGDSMKAQVVVAQEPTLSIPKQAIVERPEGKVLYVVKPDNTVTERLVSTGYTDEQVVEITDGLKPGETIAIDGAGFLSQGAKVDIIKAPVAKAIPIAQ